MFEDLRGELNSLRNQLEEKEEALHYLEDANKILMVKQVASNQELQTARIAAIQEVIDEDDPKLKELREEWGEEAYTGVIEALMGLNQHNASGRYLVSEL